MIPRRLFASAVVLLLASTSLFAATAVPVASNPIYAAFRTARPDDRIIAVNNYEFDRDVYHFKLNGALYLLPPVDNVDVGCVFVGEGTYTLTPATDVERHTLALSSGDDKLKVLTETFTSGVFFDSQLIAKAGGPDKGTVAPEANKALDDFLKYERKELKTNLHIRVLQDVEDPADPPLFLAYIRGKNLPPAILAVDPRGVNALGLHIDDGGEKTMFFNVDAIKRGFWYLADLESEIASGRAARVARPATAELYSVDTTIAPNAEVSGKTTMTLTATNNFQVLPLSMVGKLRIDDVAFSPATANPPAWTSVAFVQQKADEDDDAALIFPKHVRKGDKLLVRVTYHGIDKRVMEEAGDGNYTVSARQSWYPNVGSFQEPSMFELTFRYPEKYQIVATGKETENRVEGDQRVSVWKSEHPIRVAGFNYGKFKKLTQNDAQSGMTLEVYTNPGEPDIIKRLNQAADAGGSGREELQGGVRIDTSSLAQAAFADGANMARAGKVFFGPLADNHVAITQQSQWFFGQSWPGLIYMPYLAFVGSTVRHNLGFGLGMSEFVDLVGPHEFAHQWWGHQVGWASYHDQWLSEGFAEFSAALVLQFTKGPKAYDDFWEKRRKEIFERPIRATITNEDAGPITQGFRLSTWQDRGGYRIIVYEKGAFVLHMLRMLMSDPKKQNRDENFAAMMTDFATTYAGKNPSTADFEAIVQKHATPMMKIAPDGNVHWFFKQWVYGIDAPKLAGDLKVADSGGGKYHISGTITQSEVPNDFTTIVPLYLTFDKGAVAKMGSMVVIGNQTKTVDVDLPLPRKPKSVDINLLHDVLTR
ncbi:MAG TPA: M1 family aminopeptidase [Thermoanaerobaculia bacterium]|nr:M1 family aminopeptidase [Thermoanaerobaculia bacterium]